MKFAAYNKTMQQHWMISREAKLAPSFFEPQCEKTKNITHRTTKSGVGNKKSGGWLMIMSCSPFV